MKTRCRIPATLLAVSCLAGLLWMTASRRAFAQNQFGQITGLVMDASKSSIPGANVTVVNEDTHVSSQAVTTNDGNYNVPSLLPGRYRVTASKVGFESVTQTDIVLQVGQTARIDFSLPVGAVSQQVEVQASAAAILQTESAEIGNVVPEAGVVNLPLNGRDYLQLATLVPGTNSAGLGKSDEGMPWNNLNINGMRQSATAYVIDGADVMEQFDSGTAYTPAPDAIQEFKVETNNMTAQYGGGGGIVNVVLKSGTNNLHGNVYEFWRNDILDARNYFAQTNPELRYNQFGATIGGPIKHDKLFYFGDYEGSRFVNGVTYNTFVPTAAERQGNFTGVTQIHDPYTGQPLANDTVAQIAPQAAYFLQFIPDANATGGTYVRTVSGYTNLDQYDIRFDAHLRNADLVSFTWTQQIGSTNTPGPLPLNGGTNGPNKGEFGVVNWTHTLGVRGVNQATYSYARNTAVLTGQGIGTNYTVQSGISGFEDTSLDYPGPPSMNISGYSSINGYPFLPLGQTYNHYNVTDNLTLVVGRHTVQFGGGARWYDQFNYNGAWSRGSFDFSGTYTGDAFADFLYGMPLNGERGFPRNPFGSYQRNQYLFAQDTWKATPRLSLNGGLRWDVIHPSTALHNTFASTDPATDQIIVATGSSGKIDTAGQQVTPIVLPIFQSRIIPSASVGLPKSLIYTNWHNFAPRLGAAYQLPNDMVIRAGYGIFFPLEQGNQAVSSPIVNPPFIVDQRSYNTTPVPNQTLGDMFPPTTPGNYALGPVAFNYINPHVPTQYIQEWNTAVQKGFGRALSVQLAYVGSKGTHLPFLNPMNVPPPGAGDIQSRRLNTFFGEGFDLSNIGYSNYNSLQATVQVQGWHGLYMLSSYTWGKSLDDMSSDNNNGSNVQDPSNLQAEYGISDFNLTNRFTSAVTYQLPRLSWGNGLVRSVLGGWSVSTIVTLQSGPPFTPALSTDPANTGTVMRPDRIGNRGKLSNPTIQQWFDVSAFPVPADYTYGNAGRNILTGPGLKDWDAGLFKSFSLEKLRHDAKMEFRGEFFNATNTPPFGLPDADVQDVTAGRVLSAGSPREAQLSIKLAF